MLLKTLNKIYPDDFIYYSPVYQTTRGGGKVEDPTVYKWRPPRSKAVTFPKDHKKNKDKEISRLIRREHHETFILIKTLQGYDLTNIKQRAEAVAVLTLALLDDPHGTVFDTFSKLTKAIKVLNETVEIAEYLEQIDELKRQIDILERSAELIVQDSLGLGKADSGGEIPPPLSIQEWNE